MSIPIITNPSHLSPFQFPNGNGNKIMSKSSDTDTDIDNEMLEEYKTKMTIMSQMCQDSAGHFTSIKNKLTLPLIIISAGLVVLNSLGTNQDDDQILERIAYVNIALNTINFIIVSYQNQFRISEKAQTFKNMRDDFIRILHSVDTAKNGGTLNNQFLCNLIDKYDTLIGGCPSIPGYIKTKVINSYKNHNKDHLPVILTATLVQ